MFFVVSIATSAAWLRSALFDVGAAAGVMWVIRCCRWAIPCLPVVYFTVWFCIEAAKSVENSSLFAMGCLSCTVFLYSIVPVPTRAWTSCWTFPNRLTCLPACMHAWYVSCSICADNCLCKWNILMANYGTCPPSRLTLSGVPCVDARHRKVSWTL